MTTARPRNASQTRAEILTAARRLFGSDGYERTTIRAVAGAVGIDPALVMQYFGSKEGLFAAAAAVELVLPDLAGVAPDRVADLLVPVFLHAWRPDGAFLGLLRAAATNARAAEALRGVFRDQVAPVLAAVVPDHPAERAALVGSQLLGVAVTRHLLSVPAVAAMTEADLVEWLRPVVARYLTEPRA